MSDKIELPLWDVVCEGWKAAFAAMVAMPQVMAVALVLSFANALVLPDIVPINGQMSPAQYLASAIVGAIGAITGAPSSVAIHRHILANDRTESYFRDIMKVRVWAFAGMSILISLLVSIPSLLMALFGAAPFLLLCLFAALIGALYFSVRLGLTMPQLALDGAISPSVGESIEISRGRFWKLFFICFVGLLPIIIVSTLVTHTLGLKTWLSTGILTLTSFLNWSVAVALVSVVFARLKAVKA